MYSTTNKISFVAGSCAALLAGVAEAGPNFGQRECPEYSPMADFDISAYAGTWYEIVRDRATPFELMK